jgi:hypothetical protein
MYTFLALVISFAVNSLIYATIIVGRPTKCKHFFYNTQLLQSARVGNDYWDNGKKAL